VSISADGTIWGISKSGQPHCWVAGAWKNMHGKANEIYVGSSDNIISLNMNLGIPAIWTGSTWKKMVSMHKFKSVCINQNGHVWGCDKQSIAWSKK